MALFVVHTSHCHPPSAHVREYLARRYHNLRHALDVAQFCFVVIREDEIAAEILQPLEQLALLLLVRVAISGQIAQHIVICLTLHSFTFQYLAIAPLPKLTTTMPFLLLDPVESGP